MKVLLVSSSSGSHGGGEFYLALLAEGLVDLGCDVTVLMSNSANMDGLAEMIGPIAGRTGRPWRNERNPTGN